MAVDDPTSDCCALADQRSRALPRHGTTTGGRSR